MIEHDKIQHLTFLPDLLVIISLVCLFISSLYGMSVFCALLFFSGLCGFSVLSVILFVWIV